MSVRKLFLTILLLFTIAVSLSADPQYWDFHFPSRASLENPAVDLRQLNEAYAGEHGFIKPSPDGNSYVRGDGLPIRFWGVTPRLEFGDQPMDSLRQMARFYAQIGINMVRIHTQISPKQPGSKITDVDAQEIDDIHKLVAAFKAEGIYLAISPYWPSGYFFQYISEEWGIDGYSGRDKHMWNVLFFNEKLQHGYKAWVRELYTGDNPYTGIPLKDDPAVAIIQVQNEDGMLWWTVDQLEGPQKQILESKYSVFIKDKYGSLDKAMQAWDNESVDGDDPANGLVKLYSLWELTRDQTGGKAARVHDQTEFLATLQYNFYSAIADYYHHELGCKQMVNPGNWYTASMAKMNDLERWTYSNSQVMAVNRYFSPGHIGENSGWRIDPGHYYVGKSVLFNPASNISNIKQPVGYPMFISEGGWNLPGKNLAEAPFITAVYQSLTGVDGLLWYTTLPPHYDVNPYWPVQDLVDGQPPLRRWSISVPQLMGQFPANALVYRMGYVQEGEPAVVQKTNPDELLQRKDPPILENSGFDPNRQNMAKLQNDIGGTEVNPLAFAAGPVCIDLNADETGYSVHPDLDKLIDLDNKTVKSVTGELLWDYGNGVVTLNSPKAQGACGFNIGKIELNDVSIDCQHEYTAIQVVALDDQPLADSKKVLVQIGTRAQPTGWQEGPAEFGSEGREQKGYKILNTGHMPWQIERVDLKLNIHNSSLTRATLLDAGLAVVRDIKTEKTGNGVIIQPPSDTMYLLLQ